MKIQHQLAALLFATTLFAACSKEDKETSNSGTNCKVTKALMYGINSNGLFADTLTYTYTDANITKVTGPTYYFTFDYAGERIVRRNYFDSLTATASSDYETITYNSDGTVAAIESYSENGNELEGRHKFTYSSGKLVKLAYTPYWNGVASKYLETHFYTYTGNNITRDSVEEISFDRTDYSIYYYSYDAQENHFNKSGSNALFYSAIAMDIDGGMLPFFMSANNVTTFRDDEDPEKTTFSYTMDANGNLNLMKVDDTPGLLYQYQCP